MVLKNTDWVWCALGASLRTRCVSVVLTWPWRQSSLGEGRRGCLREHHFGWLAVVPASCWPHAEHAIVPASPPSDAVMSTAAAARSSGLVAGVVVLGAVSSGAFSAAWLAKKGAERQHAPGHRCCGLLYMRRTCAWRRGVSSARRRNPRVLCRTRTRRNAWRKPWSPPPLLRAAILLCHGVCLSKDATPTTEKKTSNRRAALSGKTKTKKCPWQRPRSGRLCSAFRVGALLVWAAPRRLG
jgi:hypothetical protein